MRFQTLKVAFPCIIALAMLCAEVEAVAATVVRIHYPVNGRSLMIRGADPLRWDTDTRLTEVEAGVGEIAFADSAPTEFKALLNGSWSVGENMRIVPGRTNDVWPRFAGDHGRVVELAAVSGRRVWAYLPPSYDEHPTRRFPVWYAQDGQNLFEATRGQGSPVTWSVDRSLDQVANRFPAQQEVIVIGVAHGGASRIFDYTPTADGGQGGGANAYLTWLVGTLKPTVERTLRIDGRREVTGIFGSSLGGLFSMYAAAKRPDVFGRIGAFSPSAWWDDLMIRNEVLRLGQVAQRPAKFYVDFGERGDGGGDTSQMIDALRQIGYRDGSSLLVVVDPDGHHDETSWARRFSNAAAFLSR